MIYPCGSPSITEREIARVVQSMQDGRLTQGKSVLEFEARLAELLNVQHVVACASGTAALHLALASLELKPGDEVLVPDVSFVATANAVSYTGATPVLVDIDHSNWNIDLVDAERKISSRARVILPVHLYGVPCDMDEMQLFADKHSLEIVEDAAESFGGHWQGTPSGTHGICGTFSFYANKIITTGEGGAVVTNNQGFAETLRFLRGQAQSPIRRFWHSEIGFNYRMTDIAASIGLAQLERLSEFLEERHRVVATYRTELHGTLQYPEQDGMAPWMFTGAFRDLTPYTRAENRLKVEGIESRPVFTPMHRLPMYARPDRQFPVSCHVSDYGISLPTYPSLSDADVRTIATCVIGAE